MSAISASTSILSDGVASLDPSAVVGAGSGSECNGDVWGANLSAWGDRNSEECGGFPMVVKDLGIIIANRIRADVRPCLVYTKVVG